MIKFRCNNCGKKFIATENQAGKKGTCPKCKHVVHVPESNERNSVIGRSGLESNSGTSGLDTSLFDIPQKTKTAEESIAQQDMPDKNSEGLQEFEEGMGVGEPEPADVHLSRLPWIIDIFLYPFNLAGIIHLIGLWLLVFLLCPLLIAMVDLGTEYVPLVYFLPVAYLLYYLTECIRDSALGHCRAPDFWMHPADSSKWECVLQLFVVLGSIAVCFCPVAVYYIATERSDSVYWILLACGGFFFPMVLLAVVLFDSFNALNPILIIGSICRTLLPYCGMVLFFYAGALLFMEIGSPINRFWLLPLVPFLIKGVQLYMINVAVGLLGRFYHRCEDKLNWEV